MKPTPVSSPARQFIDSVLRLQPKIALLDCDGTLWDADSGAGFFYWELDRKLLPEKMERWARARYEDYKARLVDEETMCGEMVTINAGLEISFLEREAEEFFTAKIEPLIFPEMLELTRGLAASGCQMWAVSSTADFVVRVGARRFGIPPERILAACVEVANGRATDRLIRVPTGPGKAEAARERVPGVPDLAMGNTVHDAAMLAMARHAWAIKPNPDLEKMARERRWGVYVPE